MGLEASVVNDSNRVLTVEGTAELPEGAPVVALLQEGERILGRGRATLRHGRFFMTLDVERVPGNTPLDLEVAFDPLGAPGPVLREVGSEGERMVGDQVEEEGGRLRVVDRLAVVLPMSRRDAALRQVQAGDLVEGAAGLEAVVAQVPEDLEAATWLALARLQRNPAERKPGSTSHRALVAAWEAGLGEPARSEARAWLDRLDRAGQEEAREQARRDDLRRQQEARLEIRPGRSLAGVELGMPAGTVFARYTPDRFPAFRGGTETVRLPDLGVEVELDGLTRRVTRVSTSDPRFRLPGDLGVGSPLQAFQERFPGGFGTFPPLQRGPEGVRRARGAWRLPSEGLVLGVERVIDEIGLPEDEVVELGVVQRAPSGPAPGRGAGSLPNP